MWDVEDSRILKLARATHVVARDCCAQFKTTEGLGIISYLLERCITGFYFAFATSNTIVATAMLMNLQNIANKLWIPEYPYEGTAYHRAKHLLETIEMFEVDNVIAKQLSCSEHVETTEQQHIQRLLRRLRETEKLDLGKYYFYDLSSSSQITFAS